ncbi:hypothetical protein ATO11_06670 [Pseudaestuariivita atlantica]|uniref:Peptidase S41 n=2 Tax=Pseudaestuariivita atlantica TaxID=1317121 RepID=A0A0L1JQB1_9RHOB|nr:hypothetical protein ATO11_06670 [Pseudaestuariivita atlantica]
MGAALDRMRDVARTGSRDAFLLAAMRVLALAGNGHTRIIPMPALEVIPSRIVARGAGWHLCGADGGTLEHVDGIDPETLFARWTPFLAGTPARQRAVAGVMFAWPAALSAGGIDPGRQVTFGLSGGGSVACDMSTRVPALDLYPVHERGGDVPGADPWAKSDSPGTRVRLASLAEAEVPDLDAVIADASRRVAAGDGQVVLDLRGNPGGSFLKALPLVAALDAHAARCAVQVDRYTFSAAIVVAVLVRHRLGARARLFGETMGDGLTFWAEGGTATLPQTGALLRWSDGFHDWAHGDPEGRGPADLRPHMVATGTPHIHPERDLEGWLTA